MLKWGVKLPIALKARKMVDLRINLWRISPSASDAEFNSKNSGKKKSWKNAFKKLFLAKKRPNFWDFWDFFRGKKWNFLYIDPMQNLILRILVITFLPNSVPISTCAQKTVKIFGRILTVFFEKFFDPDIQIQIRGVWSLIKGVWSLIKWWWSLIKGVWSLI